MTTVVRRRERRRAAARLLDGQVLDELLLVLGHLVEDVAVDDVHLVDDVREARLGRLALAQQLEQLAHGVGDEVVALDVRQRRHGRPPRHGRGSSVNPARARRAEPPGCPRAARGLKRMEHKILRLEVSFIIGDQW